MSCWVCGRNWVLLQQVGLSRVIPHRRLTQRENLLALKIGAIQLPHAPGQHPKRVPIHKHWLLQVLQIPICLQDPQIWKATVDGRYPAPVDRWFIPLFIGFQPSRWCRISSIHSMSCSPGDAHPMPPCAVRRGPGRHLLLLFSLRHQSRLLLASGGHLLERLRHLDGWVSKRIVSH